MPCRPPRSTGERELQRALEAAEAAAEGAQAEASAQAEVMRLTIAHGSRLGQQRDEELAEVGGTRC
jgi:hypothetical protein